MDQIHGQIQEWMEWDRGSRLMMRGYNEASWDLLWNRQIQEIRVYGENETNDKRLIFIWILC